MNRWWIYQRERFPIFAHGALILAFSGCAVSYSSLLHGTPLPGAPAFAVAFVTCFLFFLQLRIADEFKDHDEDSRHRPYRPVPRGLVSLRSLGWVFVLGAIVQLAAALAYHRPLAVLLGVTWLYLALMSVEFFAADWLKARPVTYLWTHMLIMPLVDLYATACHWMPAGLGIHPGLRTFLAVSFLNGVVIEIGRKIRAPGAEEPGVPTYTKLWGTKRAPWIWLTILLATAGLGVFAASSISFAAPASCIFAAVLVAAAVLTATFTRSPSPSRGKLFESASALWTLTLYLTLGLAPLIANR